MPTSTTTTPDYQCLRCIKLANVAIPQTPRTCYCCAGRVRPITCNGCWANPCSVCRGTGSIFFACKCLMKEWRRIEAEKQERALESGS